VQKSDTESPLTPDVLSGSCGAAGTAQPSPCELIAATRGGVALRPRLAERGLISARIDLIQQLKNRHPLGLQFVGILLMKCLQGPCALPALAARGNRCRSSARIRADDCSNFQ
jgi:hypothetical protein